VLAQGNCYIKAMKSTYIWGAGHYGVLTALDCEQRGIEVAGFIEKFACRFC